MKCKSGLHDYTPPGRCPECRRISTKRGQAARAKRYRDGNAAYRERERVRQREAWHDPANAHWVLRRLMKGQLRRIERRRGHAEIQT